MRIIALVSAAILLCSQFLNAEGAKRETAGRRAVARGSHGQRLIIWSIDGFAAGYLDNPAFQKSAVWQRLLKKGRLFNPVETTIPSVTYPAHTAMVTGKDTAEHRIHSNHPVDPFQLSKDGWAWYAEDISSPALWDIARKQKKTVANMMWPVTMVEGKKIPYHFPQFERGKGPEELKLMRILSTPGLHREVERYTGVGLNEHSTDLERIRAARYIWRSKRPDLMLLYNPGLDSIEHADGPYSATALKHLDKLGFAIENFLHDLHSQGEKNSAILIVSDHGFMSYEGKCFPNFILRSMGLINEDTKTWSYFFHTAGGVARLVRNKKAPGFPAAEFSERLKACGSVEYIPPGTPDYDKLRLKFDSGAPAFLLSRGNVIISSGAGKEAYTADAKGHTHGFLPDRKDMHTLALFLGPGRRKTERIRHTKDTFRFACSWLRLRCGSAKTKAH